MTGTPKSASLAPAHQPRSTAAKTPGKARRSPVVRYRTRPRISPARVRWLAVKSGFMRGWKDARDHRLLRTIEQEPVADHTHPATDVLRGVPGEAAPRGVAQGSRPHGPLVDSDRSVTQVGDRPVDGYRLRPGRRRVHEHGCPEVPREALVAERHGRCEVGTRPGRRELHDPQDIGEHLVVEQARRRTPDPSPSGGASDSDPRGPRRSADRRSHGSPSRRSPGSTAASAGSVRSSRRISSRSAGPCAQPSGMTRTWVALHTCPQLSSFVMAIRSACRRTSASDHGPGTTITGLTPPNSALKGFSSSRVPATRFLMPSSPVPQTSAS